MTIPAQIMTLTAELKADVTQRAELMWVTYDAIKSNYVSILYKDMYMQKYDFKFYLVVVYRSLERRFNFNLISPTSWRHSNALYTTRLAVDSFKKMFVLAF